MNNSTIVIGNTSDSYFAIDIADYLNQRISASDLVSLKTFANSEFCPRYTLGDENDKTGIGKSLTGKNVVIVSVHNRLISRNDLAMRNLILARAAKDNSAKSVVLVEPDLFYSAQDRGPKPEHGTPHFKRTLSDYYKFNGQPYTARLYAQLLKEAGVDAVITIHNHSYSTCSEFERIFGKNNFVNLYPDIIFHHYICHSGIVNPDDTILVAPDEGAFPFVVKVSAYKKPVLPFIAMNKIRRSERSVKIRISGKSTYDIESILNKDVVVLDDMVRTGSTVVACCKILQEYNPRKIIFMLTHFNSSFEVRQNLDQTCIDEIITTNTMPDILNRDNQGRLRKKMAVLKITKWIAGYLEKRFDLGIDLKDPFYEEDMSNKNPRANRFNL
jgi:ribose-phosphate pyrophosphokinase